MSALIPTNPPCTFKIYVVAAEGGILSAVRTNGTNTTTEQFNSGDFLVANCAYYFYLHVDEGDSIDFVYNATTNFPKFAVVELDMAVGVPPTASPRTWSLGGGDTPGRSWSLGSGDTPGRSWSLSTADKPDRSWSLSGGDPQGGAYIGTVYAPYNGIWTVMVLGIGDTPGLSAGGSSVGSLQSGTLAPGVLATYTVPVAAGTAYTITGGTIESGWISVT